MSQHLDVPKLDEHLAMLGRLASTLAHEIRNPLGVIAANLRLLESQGANTEVCSAIRHQVEGVRTFVDGMLRYGRPRPLELRVALRLEPADRHDPDRDRGAEKARRQDPGDGSGKNRAALRLSSFR